MTSEYPEFYDQLKNGPAVLFLGQDYLKLGTGVNPLLQEIKRKYGPDNLELHSYDAIFKANFPDEPEIFLSWLNDRVSRLVTQPSMKTVSSFAWNNVYTSAIDNQWYRGFRTEWRELFPIYEEKIRPTDPRSRIRLQCTFLFGCIDQPAEDKNKRPPLKSFEKNKRRQEAIALLRRLPEIISPLGVFAIEGYDGNTDWLSWDDLLPIIDELNPGQTHLFSTDLSSINHPDVIDFVQKNKIILHDEGLGHYLNRVAEEGEIKLGQRADEDGGKYIKVNNNSLLVPTELLSIVSRSAIVLDDSLFERLDSIGPEKTYSEFRHFLSDSGTRPVWSGYQRGFNFQRKFEQRLYKKVESEINAKELHENPIVLHGQSGSGKTVALGALAYKIRKNKKCVVLFIERRSQRPDLSDIEQFSKWAEDSGSPATLVIWDGMHEVGQYREFSQYFSSRGRKVVLVGSSYLLDIPDDYGTDRNSNYVKAPNALGDEFPDFENFLRKLDPALGSFVSHIRRDDEYFLVALYRALPDTRKGIQEGIVKETHFAEKKLIDATSDISLLETSLAYALYEAGFIELDELQLTSSKVVDNENVSEVQELIGLVMVPGRFGIKIPIEIIMRALGKTWMDDLPRILQKVDIFRWYEDNVGNILIGPRHPLEAQMIVHARMGSAKTEIEYAKRLLLEIRPTSVYDNQEIQFAVDLVRSLGPNGVNAAYFSSYFVKISEILEELRTVRGVENPRLMLQEGSLLREWIKSEQEKRLVSVEEAQLIFSKSRKVLSKALDLLEDDYRNSGIRSTILVELGTNLASQNKGFIEAGKTEKSYKEFRNAKKFLYNALALNPGDFHPVDVIYWMTKDLLDSEEIKEEVRAELETDLINVFSMVEPDEYPDDQKVNYFQRSYQLGKLINEESLSDEAFDRLAQMGSKAGYYLKALSMAGEIPSNKPINPHTRRNFNDAFQYLEKHHAEIIEDSRCLNLLLKLWWMEKTGKPIFYEERQTLPFNANGWGYLLRLTTELLSTSSLYNSISINYIKGLSLFHLGDVNASVETFREVERDSGLVRGGRRIYRHHLASNPDGSPREFQGNILWVNLDQKRGEVYIPALRNRIKFIPQDFPRWREFRKDEPLGNFYVAFNFIGPIADPRGFRTIHMEKKHE